MIYTINHAPVRSVVVARGAAAERAHDETDFPAGRCTAPSRTATRCRHRQCSPAVRRPHRRSTKARRHLFTGRSSRRTSHSSRCLDRSCWSRPCVTNPGGRAADGADPQVSDGRRRHEVRAAARSFTSSRGQQLEQVHATGSLGGVDAHPAAVGYGRNLARAGRQLKTWRFVVGGHGAAAPPTLKSTSVARPLGPRQQARCCAYWAFPPRSERRNSAPDFPGETGAQTYCKVRLGARPNLAFSPTKERSLTREK